MVVFVFTKGIATWNKNNHSPRITVKAKVVAKRQDTTHHNYPNGGEATGAYGYYTVFDTLY